MRRSPPATVHSWPSHINHAAERWQRARSRSSKSSMAPPATTCIKARRRHGAIRTRSPNTTCSLSQHSPGLNLHTLRREATAAAARGSPCPPARLSYQAVLVVPPPPTCDEATAMAPAPAIPAQVPAAPPVPQPTTPATGTCRGRSYTRAQHD